MISKDREKEDTKMREINEKNTIKQMMRICGTKRQTGILHVNKPLYSTGRENNTYKGHEQIQETKRIK